MEDIPVIDDQKMGWVAIVTGAYVPQSGMKEYMHYWLHIPYSSKFLWSEIFAIYVVLPKFS